MKSARRALGVLPAAALFLALLMIAVSPCGFPGALAQTPQAQMDDPAGDGAAGSPLTPDQEALAAKIFNELISPCCWTTTVATHGSGAAPRIQAEVRAMISRGMTHQKILDHYVEQYGERILATPKKTGFNLAAYWVPYLAILIGAALIVAMFRKRRMAVRAAEGAADRKDPRAAASPPVPPSGEDAEYRRRLEEEVRRIS